MKYVRAAAVGVMCTLGAAAVVYGGYDDSPGAQLIGIVLVVGAVVLAARAIRRRA